MVVVLLTALSWITFVMDPSDLNDRCGISLTLLLALNVFQLILSELMPKTGYLTPMHEAGPSTRSTRVPRVPHAFHAFLDSFDCPGRLNCRDIYTWFNAVISHRR